MKRSENQEADEDRPKKSRKKNGPEKKGTSVWLWVGIGGGVTLLFGVCGCAGLAWYVSHSVREIARRPPGARRITADQLKNDIVGKWLLPDSKKTAYEFKPDGTVVGSFGGIQELVCPYKIVNDSTLDVTVRIREDLLMGGIPVHAKKTYLPPGPERKNGVYILEMRYSVYITEEDRLHLAPESGPWGLGYLREKK